MSKYQRKNLLLLKCTTAISESVKVADFDLILIDFEDLNGSFKNTIL